MPYAGLLDPRNTVLWGSSVVKSLIQWQLLLENDFRSCHGEFSHSKAHVKSCALLGSWTLISGIIN